jgi:hypothetical protein
MVAMQYASCARRITPRDTKTWMLAVDMAKKTLVELAPISAQKSMYNPHAVPLSKYLKTDQGL